MKKKLEKIIFYVLKYREKGFNIHLALHETIDGWNSKSYELDEIRIVDLFEIMNKKIDNVSIDIEQKSGIESVIFSPEEFKNIWMEDNQLHVKLCGTQWQLNLAK